MPEFQTVDQYGLRNLRDALKEGYKIGVVPRAPLLFNMTSDKFWDPVSEGQAKVLSSQGRVLASMTNRNAFGKVLEVMLAEDADSPDAVNTVKIEWYILKDAKSRPKIVRREYRTDMLVVVMAEEPKPEPFKDVPGQKMLFD